MRHTSNSRASRGCHSKAKASICTDVVVLRPMFTYEGRLSRSEEFKVCTDCCNHISKLTMRMHFHNARLCGNAFFMLMVSLRIFKFGCWIILAFMYLVTFHSWFPCWTWKGANCFCWWRSLWFLPALSSHPKEQDCCRSCKRWTSSLRYDQR